MMIYQSAADWRAAKQKRVLVFGMSGLGKTHASSMLRDQGDWFHYSVDYRIGTRYMGEYIVDNFKREAMRNPFLAELLKSDSIYIGSNITFDNLDPLSTYLGKPGDPDRGGLPLSEYTRRQAQHHGAERAAMLDCGYFIERATDIYGYDHFVCDSSGSICEVVDPDDPKDEVLTDLSSRMLMVWIQGSEDDTANLIARFDKAPKPMCYQPGFLASAWADYLAETGLAEDRVDPDTFVRWTFARAMQHRAPLYAAMAKNWGVTVASGDIGSMRDAADFDDVIAAALENT